MSPELSESALEAACPGWHVVLLDPVGSTSDWAARALSEREIGSGTLVTTPHQLAGRGQYGRRWHGDPGAVAVTFVLPEFAGPLHELPMRAGQAVADLVGEIVPRGVTSKWPNDVLIDGRKVAGVLCENKHGCTLVGVGLNVHLDTARLPAELREIVTDLAAHADRCPSRTQVIAGLAKRIAALRSLP